MAMDPGQSEMNNQSQKIRGQRGYSLIEILAAMVTMGIMASSVYYLLSFQNRLSANSADELRAANLGKIQIDSLKVVDYAALVAGSDTLQDKFILSWTVSLQTGTSSGTKKINLTVLWPLTAENTLTFTSLKSDDIYKEDP